MRVRALDENGDMTFGRGSGNFLVDTPAAVAQCILTRLALRQGEWWLDPTAGVAWDTQILGTGTAALRDLAIKEAVLETPGVVSIDAYASAVDPVTRAMSVQMTVTTRYGATSVTTTV
jgi:hypothetical protein